MTADQTADVRARLERFAQVFEHGQGCEHRPAFNYCLACFDGAVLAMREALAALSHVDAPKVTVKQFRMTPAMREEVNGDTPPPGVTDWTEGVRARALSVRAYLVEEFENAHIIRRLNGGKPRDDEPEAIYVPLWEEYEMVKLLDDLLASLQPHGDQPPAETALDVESMRGNLHATFNGGHQTPETIRAFHHGMDTVCNVLVAKQKGEGTNGILPLSPTPEAGTPPLRPEVKPCTCPTSRWSARFGDHAPECPSYVPRVGTPPRQEER